MIGWIRNRLWPLLRSIGSKWSEDEGSLLSAAMAYYAAFSLFPLCLILIALLGVVTRLSPHVRSEQEQLLRLVAENVGPWLAQQLASVLAGVQTRALVGGPLGLFTLIAVAIGMFTQFETIFEKVWRVPQPQTRGIWHAIRAAFYDRVVAFVMLLAVGGLLLVVFVADMVLSGLATYAESLPAGHYVWRAVRLTVTLAVYTGIFTLIYKWFPPAFVRWREAAAGGLLVAVVWELGQRILASALIGQKYSAYGVVGAFIAIMLWLYYVSAIVFLGAEFVQSICRDCNTHGVGQRPSAVKS